MRLQTLFFGLMRRILLILAALFAVVLLAGAGINVHILRSTDDSVFPTAAVVPARQAALVLGARVYKSGAISPILADRLETAVELFQAGKVEAFIVSGDHGTEEYDEVHSMRDYLTASGVPAEDVFMDHAGFDTYDSVYRAKTVFQAESLIIVTQEFHLPRALYIADALGIEAVGVIADKREYGRGATRRNALREPLARVKAWMSVQTGAEPAYLGEAIPVTGDGRATEDR